MSGKTMKRNTGAWLMALLSGGLVMGGFAEDGTARNSWAPYFMEETPADFSASWIGPGPGLHSDAAGEVFFVRKRFEVKDPAGFARVRVSADSQYILWVNGREAARGPAHFDPLHQVYDTLDLSGFLTPGENVLVAEVMYWGLETNRIPYFQCSAKPGFLFDSPALKSDGTWRAWISPGHTTAGKKNCRAGGAAYWYERVDAREVPEGIPSPAFDDDAWPRAEVIGDAEKWGEQTDTSSPWKLYPRRIPAPEVRAAAACVPVQSGAVKGDAAEPPFPFEVVPDAEAPSLPWVSPGGDSTRYLVLDAGELVNGYVSLDIEGVAGTVVEVMYAEAPELDRKKGRRDRLEERRIEGSADVYILRDGRQQYQPFLHRTFRFVRVAVRGGDATVHGLTHRWTGYPFAERGRFTCSDETLNQIWRTGWNTQRLCAFDTFQDCPYYERLQYGGDTRIQGLITLYASGDTRLLANAVRQLQASSLPEGLTQSRYPNHVFQVIPGYSLCWIQMLDDYYLHTGDLSLVRECAHTVASVLRFYERHLTDQGFAADLPYWNFYDWTYEKSGVPDAHGENCTLSTIHYKGALDIAARLFTALDDPLTAERFRKQAEAVSAAVNEKAWDGAAGLYRDGIATRSFSQHVNTFAVLFGVADDARRKRIAEKLFDDPSLRGTTFYFAHYLHEAAERLGMQEKIIADMARWKGMLDLGATTWWETPDAPRSECHAWSATPTYRFMEMILGVRPLAPGFSRVRVQPWTGDLEHAEGAVPTPLGDITVRWRKAPEFELEVTLPGGMTGEVTLPDGRTFEAKNGAATFR